MSNDVAQKIQDRKQIKNTENTETKHNPEKANNAKHSKTKLPYYSRQPGNEAGLFYNAYDPHGAIK